MVSAPFGFLRVAAACPKVSVADPEANQAFLLGAIREAHGRGVQVLVLPELCLAGYTCGDLFFNQTLLAGVTRALGPFSPRRTASPWCSWWACPWPWTGASTT